MTLQLRKKLPTIARNTKDGGFARRVFAFGVTLLLVCSWQQAVGQTQAQQVGWSNRGAKSWVNQAPRSSESVTSSRNLPWRRVQKATGISGTEAVQQIASQTTTGLNPSTGFTSSPVADKFHEPIAAKLSESPEAEPKPSPAEETIKINRIEPADYGSTIASVRQSLSGGGQRVHVGERYQSHAPSRAVQGKPADPFDDPFGDRVHRAASVFGQSAAQPVSNSTQRLESGRDQVVGASQQPLISLMPFEQPVNVPTEQVFVSNQGRADSGALRLHSPSREFRRKKKVALTVHSATEETTPRVASLAPPPVTTPILDPAATLSSIATPKMDPDGLLTTPIPTPAASPENSILQPSSPSEIFGVPSFTPGQVNPSPTMTPQLTLPGEINDDDTFGEMPEFPGYNDEADSPPAPDSIEENDNLDDLPEIEDPPTPEGFESNALEEDEELPDPDSDDEDDLDSEDDEDDDEADEEDESNCGRVYNDRDCCEQDEICRNAWDRLNAISINDIGIGISPPLAPLAEDEVEIEEQREKLQDAPFRDFKNRYGNIVASGTIEDYVDGKVIIRTAEGGSVPVAFQDLGYDERCFVSAWWGIPTECLIRPGQVATRDWTKTTFTWKASAVCHKSLFFEDVQLERYGHSAGPVLQPLISGAHFFSSVGMMPYSAGVYPATECHYVLGYYRPGECAPWLLPAFPLSKRGALMETAGLLGFFGLF